MQLNITTIKNEDIGLSVSNLHDTLPVLLDKQIIKALVAPNRSTQADLQQLTEQLKSEHEQSKFGKVTQQLVTSFQLQQGLRDNLSRVVEETTAVKLNGFLSQFG